MAEKTDLLSAGAIAKELGIAPALVSKAIKNLSIQPTTKKGACSYYSRDAVQTIQKSIKK